MDTKPETKETEQNLAIQPLDGDKETESILFSLPPELRNRVYKCYLVVDSTDEEEYSVERTRCGHCIIKLTSDFRLPGLHHLSRQIRSETIDIWYPLNRFGIEIIDYDPKPFYYPWYAILQGVGIEDRVRAWIKADGRQNWANLKSWCLDVKAGKCDALLYDTDDSELNIIGAAHRIAVNARGGRMTPTWMINGSIYGGIRKQITV